MNFLERSYLQHAEHLSKELTDETRIAISRSWFNENTADYWRHARMYECADCLIDEPEASWLTIGDGRWGLDSIRLRKKGLHNVLPTDISEYLLKASFERGLIPGYAIENAERLSFVDESFDFVFCKESYHHFPRPYIALYEMLRVARMAVFLVEPNDQHPGLEDAKRYVAEMQQKGVSNIPMCRHNSWEGCGNYAYTVSLREIEKLALGLDLPQIAFKGLNDHYIKGCEFEPADPEKSEIFRQIMQRIAENDLRCASGEADYALLMAGIFKCPMKELPRAEFVQRGWNVVDLPRNPHIRKDAAPESQCDVVAI